MRIAITSDLLAHKTLTGVEKYLYYLMHGLATIDQVQLILICPPPGPDGRLPEKVRIEEHKLTPWFDGNLLFPWIQKRVNSQKFDIIHYPTVIAPVFLRQCRRYKTVMTVHDLLPIAYPKFSTFKKRIYYRYFLKFLFNFMDHLIVPSYAIRNELMKWFNLRPGRISVIHEGVSELYKPGKQIKKNYLLAVSTLEPRKNFKRIIDAYIHLKTHHNISEDLVIVGKKGWAYKDLFHIPDQFSQHIIFKGYVDDQQLLELYQNAKVFVYPSLYEGFGLPVLEAMACGCPVITSDSSSLPEVAEKAALLVNPYSTKEIEDSILDILQNESLAGAMREKGLKQAKKFTWSKCAQETVEVYRSVMSC